MQGDELLRRTKELLPKIRERAVMAEQLGRMPDETIKDFIDAELLKTLAPKRFGGFELDWTVASKMIADISSCDPATGWVILVYHCTNFAASLLPERGQKEVFGDRGFVIGPCPMNPRLGTARKVEGGFLVSGREPYADGCHHAEWAVTAATIVDDDDGRSKQTPGFTRPGAIFLAIPRAEFGAHVEPQPPLGLRGADARIIEFSDVFVPSERTVDSVDADNGSSPGAKLHETPLYHQACVTSFLASMGACMGGIARGAVSAYEDLLRSRVNAVTGEKQKEVVGSQMRLAEALADVDAATLLDERDLNDLKTNFNQSGGTPTELRARIRLDCAYIANLARHAVDLVMNDCGATVISDSSNTIPRVFRDLRMLSGAYGYQFDRARQLYGGFRLGFPFID